MVDANHADHTEEPDDDTIIGVALRWSAAVLMIATVVVLSVWLLRRTAEEDVVAAPDLTTLPSERITPPLEIPEIRFSEITTEAGIDFVHENGAAGEKLLPETMGGGGAFLDFDNDGHPDLFCVNSAQWPWSEKQANQNPVSRLYRNDGSGKYQDVTEGSGLDIVMYGNGVACGDFDNDGNVDIFVSCLGRNRLFRNEGHGKFADVTELAGVGGTESDWSTSCGWFDYDNDGLLDLFVCNYIEWTRELDLAMEFTLDGKLRAYGRPTDFTGAFPYLYRNAGNGRFVDVSEEAGVRVRDPNTGVPLAKSLGVTFADVNGDGLLDIMVANDTVQNLLFLNQPGGTFLECAATAGVAFDNAGSARGAMGIDAGCFRNTDSIGFVIGNFATEMTALYVCQTPGLSMPVFRDEAVSNGLGPVTRSDLTFGVLFFDADLDGRLDVFQNNGHLEEDIRIVQASQQYEQPPHLLWNCGTLNDSDTEFVMLTEEKTGNEFTRRMVGRGASMADIDGDGDLDLILFSSGGHPRLLRNDQQRNHHWLRVKLRGTASNRDAIGAEVRVPLSETEVLTRLVMPTRSYQSQVELPVSFGLGSIDHIPEITVRWPGGHLQTVTVGHVDRLIEVEESPR